MKLKASKPQSSTVASTTVGATSLETGGVCWHSAVYGGVAGGVVCAVTVGIAVFLLYITWRKRSPGHTRTPNSAGQYYLVDVWKSYETVNGNHCSYQ